MLLKKTRAKIVAAEENTQKIGSAKKFISQISKEDIERIIEAAKEVVKYDPVE